jgi:hypothetical protein
LQGIVFPIPVARGLKTLLEEKLQFLWTE